jgi:serine/threonine-protein kinase
MTSVAPGEVLAGKYRVERILGKGGMGMVVAALHLHLDKRVALKFLLPQVAQNPELVARFAREARAASRIESEHVAKVLDVGQLDDGAPFMVMEYLEGADLAQIVKTRGALPGQEAIEYVLQACEALAEAHVAGIVHRDLKPANLFLTRRADGSPCIKVLDFGISKIALAGDPGQGMTQTAAMMGSPNYMAPEQIKSARSVDARSDIWSLGIILHELLTGEVAFKADTMPELYVNILQSPPIPLRSRRPDAPPAMEAIVLRCLEKDPARRFANVGELATALGELAPPRARLSIERITRIVGTPAQPPPGVTPPTLAGTHVSTYHPGPPAYPGATPPGAYGPAYGPSGYPAGGYPQRPAQQGMSSSTIALIVIVGAVVLGFGSCMFCVCVDAVNQSAQGQRGEGTPAASGRPVSAEGDVRTVLGPFQRPAGWTTVSRGARSRPPPGPCSRSAWDAAWQARAILIARPARPAQLARPRRGRQRIGSR